uniref:Centriolar coiled-coil protein 110 n=1 Tax=Poecilia latipinna TaxID=48699 RepID=A0A3B3VS14_9TELE
MTHHDHLSLGFRRRCHTLDSQLNTFQSGAEQVDRSQERLPRFMAGVTWLAPSRRTPAAPLNQSYKVESPSACVLRPRGTPDDILFLNCFFLLGYHLSSKFNSSFYSKVELEDFACIFVWKHTEETQWRAQALEDMQRRLEEEHALQMSILLAEQEKEQQRLHLVRTKCKRSTFSNVVIFLSFLFCCSSRCKGTSSFIGVLTAEHQKAFCQIGAMIRGFLTRRLLKTEKLKQLYQTVVDTREFIQSFETEAAQKRGPYTSQDLSLQERVRAQLRAALYDIHEIFFEIPLRDRLALLQQDRELRAERKLRDLKAKTPKDRVSLSAATQRSLDRKKKYGKTHIHLFLTEKCKVTFIHQ